MRKATLFILVSLIITGCGQGEKQSVRSEVKEILPGLSIGPLFLPENHSLSSVSLNYVTSAPGETAVLFTMVGDIDWARNDRTVTRFHKMTFRDLEESAVYQFSIKGDDPGIVHNASLQTMPFGEDYQFRFVIASTDEKIDGSLSPHFIVLGSDRETVGEDEFVRFYERNRELLSSTILLPLPGLDVQGTNIDLAGPGGVYFVRYKNLCLVLVNREMRNYDFITRFVSNEPEDQNVIVLSRTGKKAVEELARRTALLNCRIFTFSRDRTEEQAMENVTTVESCQVVDIVKKHSYALYLTNSSR